jgi:uncharacterized damage-inducible protein DinB
MRLADSILAEMEQEATTTRRLLDRVPEDKLTWKPHAKSMTLGQLAAHVAGCNGQIAGLAAQDTFAMDPAAMRAPQPANKAEILAAFDKGLSEARKLLGQVDDQRMMATWALTAGDKTILSMPRAGVYRALMCNHQYHHRGQLSVYLRLLDVALPSIYGPSADENPFG